MAIVLITYRDTNPKTGRPEIYVSHGENTATGRSVVLEQDTLESYKRMGAQLDPNMGEWVLAA